MRCLIDTNILISAALWPDSIPAKAYSKAISSDHEAFVSSYTLFELRDVFSRKFPHMLDHLETFISNLRNATIIIQSPAPDELNFTSLRLRDLNDEPILYAAIKAKVNCIITGDKDFLESGIDNPRIMTARQFLSKE